MMRVHSKWSSYRLVYEEGLYIHNGQKNNRPQKLLVVYENRTNSKVEQTFGNAHGDSAVLLVDSRDDIFGSGNESTVLKAEEDVNGRIINRGNTSDVAVAVCIDDIIAYDGRPRNVLVIAVGELTGEVDIAARQFFCTLKCVDALKLHQGVAVSLETIFLNEEGH